MVGYVVVYATDIKQYFVVHVNWILDFDFEKNIMNSLNRNQIHLVYFSSFEEAKTANGEPNGEYKPKFGLPTMVYDPVFDYNMHWEGVFKAKLYRFFRKYNFVNTLFVS